MTVNITKPAINLRSELADLRKPTGIAGEAMLRAETPQEQFQLIGAGRRNWIINGNHIVNQRGLLPVTGMSENAYQNTDRWRSRVGGVTANSALVSNTGFKSLKATATSTGTGIYFIGFDQKIEDLDQFKGKWVTFSARVRSNSPHACLLFGGLGIGDDTVFHSGSGEWETLTLPYFVTDAASGYPLMHIVIFTNGSITISSGDYIEFTQAQLEVGKVATPFEHRSYGEELAACQRYYWQTESHLGGLYAYDQIGQGFIRTTNTDDSPVTIQAPFPVPMRVRPAVGPSTTDGEVNFTAQIGNTSANIDTIVGTWASGRRMAWLDFDITSNPFSVGQAVSVYCNNGAMDIQFDAEL